VKIDDMQFGFIPGKGTADATVVVRQLHEKLGAQGKRLILDLWTWKRCWVDGSDHAGLSIN